MQDQPPLTAPHRRWVTERPPLCLPAPARSITPPARPPRRRFALPLVPVPAPAPAGESGGGSSQPGPAAPPLPPGWSAFEVDESAEPALVKPEDIVQIVAPGCARALCSESLARAVSARREKFASVPVTQCSIFFFRACAVAAKETRPLALAPPQRQAAARPRREGGVADPGRRRRSVRGSPLMIGGMNSRLSATEPRVGLPAMRTAQRRLHAIYANAESSGRRRSCLLRRPGASGLASAADENPSPENDRAPSPQQRAALAGPLPPTQQPRGPPRCRRCRHSPLRLRRCSSWRCTMIFSAQPHSTSAAGARPPSRWCARCCSGFCSCPLRGASSTPRIASTRLTWAAGCSCRSRRRVSASDCSHGHLRWARLQNGG